MFAAKRIFLPGEKATVTIYKVVVRSGREWNFRPTSTETDALTTRPRAGLVITKGGAFEPCCDICTQTSRAVVAASSVSTIKQLRRKGSNTQIYNVELTDGRNS